MAKFKAKFKKLVRNPNLFFKDFFEKRRYVGHGNADFEVIEPSVISTSPKMGGESRKIFDVVKKPNVLGYHYYLESYEKTRVKPNQIMFDSFWGRKIGCHPYAIYKKIRENLEFLDYEFVWVKQSDVNAPLDVVNDIRVSFVEYGSQEYAAALLTSSVLIANSNFSPYFSPKVDQFLISTWHGIPMKTLGYDANSDLESVYNTQRNFNISDVVLSSSSYYTEKVVESYGAFIGIDKVQEVGSPRIDLTLNTEPKFLKRKLNVPKDKKIILYAPTWRGKIGDVSFNVDIQLELINFLELKLDDTYEIYVSLHHLTKKALGDTKLKINSVPEDVDINEFLSICDIVVSDYSSIFIDYLVLNKPIVLYVPDLNIYENNRGLYLHPEDLPVNVARNIDELESVFSNLKKPSEYVNYNKVISKLLPYEDGCASDRVIDTILGKKSNPYSTEKESILISVGGLKSNGITKSLFNLLENIDYSKFNIFLLVNCKLVDPDKERQFNLDLLDKRGKYILTIAPQNFSKTQKRIYNKSMFSVLNREEESHVEQAFARESRRLFGNYKFDHVIDYTGYSAYWANLLAATRSDNKIIYQHSDMLAEAENKDKGHKQLNGVFGVYKRFSKLVSVSEEICLINKAKLNHFTQNANSFVSLPNLICASDILEKSTMPLSLVSPSAFLMNLEKNLIQFICVARLSPEKGHIRLLEAFSILIRKGFNATLSIVGDGVLKADLLKRCTKLKITERVVFHGHMKNPYPLIKHSDCLILASDYEGQGLALLEAMTLGVTCIGSNISVIENIISQYGGEVADLTAEALSEAMVAFCNGEIDKPSFDAKVYTDSSMKVLYEKILC